MAQGYKKHDVKVYKEWLSQPFSTDYGISEDKIIDKFLNYQNANFQKDIIQYYGLNKDNMKSTFAPAIREKLGGIANFLFITMAEGGGAGNWINHYGLNTGGTALKDLQDDLQYVVDTYNNKNMPIAFEAPEVNGAYQEDYPGTTKKVYDSLPKGSIGAYYMPSTMAGNAWTFGYNDLMSKNVYFGNPYDNIIDWIEQLGGDPFGDYWNNDTEEEEKEEKEEKPKDDKPEDTTGKKRLIGIRKSGNFADVSNESYGTVKKKNKGHTRVRKDGDFYQAPKMKGGKVDE